MAIFSVSSCVRCQLRTVRVLLISASYAVSCSVPGIGITQEKMAHIFDAFAQVQDGQATGTGLGLFGVRTRAEGLNGSCGAYQNTFSSTGTGTVLWFTIPYVPDSSYSPCQSSAKHPINRGSTDTNSVGYPSLSPDARPSDPGFAGPSLRSHTRSSDFTVSDPYLLPTGDDPASRIEDFVRRSKLTAMVVEDTLTVRKLMEKLLMKMGFARVDCYENGSKGLDAMMERQVDIVFSDVQMPIMTGPEVCDAACVMRNSCDMGWLPAVLRCRRYSRSLSTVLHYSTIVITAQTLIPVALLHR
jgi:hypothetical protein